MFLHIQIDDSNPTVYYDVSFTEIDKILRKWKKENTIVSITGWNYRGQLESINVTMTRKENNVSENLFE